MSLTDYKITDGDLSTKGVGAAPDKLSGTAAQNKAVFDRLIREAVKEKFNDFIDALVALGITTCVQYGTTDIKHIRLGADNNIEVSADGETWVQTAAGGHIIYDKDGNQIAQRSRLKFANSAVTDDGTYTVVTGIKGDKGDTGNVGPQGPQGVKGEQGPQGYVLVPSIDDDGVISWSIQTPSGTVPASRNIRGPQGVQGVQGVQGATGATGPQGPQGIQGVQGPQGQRGNDGADGRSFTVLGLYASLAQFLAEHPTGTAGDAWAIGTAANNTIYNWDTAQETWVDIGSLQGPPGPRGEQGEQGVQGATGATGPQGVQGPAGPQGVQGIQGPEGPEGPRGFPAIVNGVTPDEEGNIDLEPSNIGAQPTINVSGILKGDGTGGVSAAVAGTDFAPAGFGLGENNGREITTSAELDSALKNGWYVVAVDASPVGQQCTMLVTSRRIDMTNIQTIYPQAGGMQGLELRRYSKSGVWQPLEWVNPPMQVGVEYRTTERYLGKPVYVKAVNCGAISANTRKQVGLGSANVSACIGCYVEAEYNVAGTHVLMPFYDPTNTAFGEVMVVTSSGASTINIHAKGAVLASTAVVKYTKTTD